MSQPSLIVQRPVATSGGAIVRPNYPNLAAVRVLAACAVIWIHTPRSELLMPSTAWGRFAVPFFLAAAIVLGFQSVCERTRGWREYLQERARRLLCPFAAWSAVYLALKLVKRVLAPDQPNDLPGWEAILLGTAYHLWFLPFMFLVSVVTFGCAQRLPWGRSSWPLAMLACGLGLVPVAWSLPKFGPRWEALEFIWLAVPTVCWTIGLCAISSDRLSRLPHPRWAIALAGSLGIAATGALWHTGRSAALEALAGLAVFYLATIPRALPGSPWFQRIASLSYGMYLSHLLFLKVAESALQRLDWPPSPVQDVVLFGGTAWASLALSWALQQFRATRWLIG